MIGRGLPCTGIMPTVNIVSAGPSSWTVSPEYTHGGGMTLTYEPENASEGATVAIRRHGFIVYASNSWFDVLCVTAQKLGIC